LKGFELGMRDYLSDRQDMQGPSRASMASTQEGKTETATAMERLEAKAAQHESLRAVDVAEAYLEDEGYRKEGLLTLRYWKGDWWRWDGPRYVELPVKDLEAKTMGFLGKNEITRGKAYTKFASDVIANLEGECFLDSSVAQPSWVHESGAVYAPDCVSMQNGILDLSGLLNGDASCLRPHSPEFFSCVALPYPFDPEATCSGWLSFLEQIQPDPQVRELLKEWFGYCLTYDTSLHKFVIFEGEGRNGKSVLCDVLRAFLGEDNVSAVPLEAFQDRFGLEPTRGKLANIAEEVGNMDKVAEGVLKTFVGGGVITMDRKWRDPVTVRATARLVFATNTRPRITDRSRGMWERLILVPFNVYIPKEKRELELAKKFYGELPGIFNWAIAGRFTLNERRRFIEPKVCIETMEDYRVEANPARAFLLERCEVSEEAEIGIAELYSEYRHYCEDNGYKSLSQSQFGKEVSRWFRESTGQNAPKITRPWVNGFRCQRYLGIGFQREEEGFGQGGHSS
jgi:putative DNA primase/helicase